MNIHTPSVVKSGGIAAATSLILALLSAIPLLGCLVWPLACLGWFLIPAGAGLGYGYLAPGKEDLAQSALGGALAGGFGGLVYGLISGILAAVTNAGMAAFIEQTDIVATASGGIFSFFFSLCPPIIGGLIFGAIGGVIWPLVQERQM